MVHYLPTFKFDEWLRKAIFFVGSGKFTFSWLSPLHFLPFYEFGK